MVSAEGMARTGYLWSCCSACALCRQLSQRTSLAPGIGGHSARQQRFRPEQVDRSCCRNNRGTTRA